MLLSRESSAVSPGRGTVVLSLDAEQIWGHLDLLDQRSYSERYPNTPAAYEHLLRMMCSAGVSATWLVVGGLALRSSEGAEDPRMSAVPRRWAGHIPAGNEVTAPLWYRRSFVQQLAKARPAQDIGLHGGLTHLIWTDYDATAEVVRAELQEGLNALSELGVRPKSFSFPRNQERFHSLLAEHPFSCYRGRDLMLSARLGRSLPGSVARLLEEVGQLTPPLVTPVERLPGLWNIPSSLFLYPMGDSRARFVPLKTRTERARRGVENAIRRKGLFHFCFHPANLAESSSGFSLFEEILEQWIKARDMGDIEILTMTQVAERMAQQTARSAAGERLPTDQVARAHPAMAQMSTVETPLLRNQGD